MNFFEYDKSLANPAINGPWEVLDFLDKDMQMRGAEFIKFACNSHETLVGIVEDTIAYLRVLGKTEDADRLMKILGWHVPLDK